MIETSGEREKYKLENYILLYERHVLFFSGIEDTKLESCNILLLVFFLAITIMDLAIDIARRDTVFSDEAPPREEETTVDPANPHYF